MGDDAADRFAREAYGRTRSEARARGICVSCGGSMEPQQYRTQADAREGRMSQLCQTCIDGIFGTDEPEE